MPNKNLKIEIEMEYLDVKSKQYRELERELRTRFEALLKEAMQPFFDGTYSGE